MKIKPPPSDRLWYGFYEMPKMELSIEPLVSTRAVKWSLVTSVIEKRLNESMEEYFVLPNMEELGLPPMKSRYEDERAGIRSDEGIKCPLHQPNRSYATVEATSLASALMSLPRKKLFAQQQLRQQNVSKTTPEVLPLSSHVKSQMTKSTTGDNAKTIQPTFVSEISTKVSKEDSQSLLKDEEHLVADKLQPPPIPPTRTSSKNSLKQRRSLSQAKLANEYDISTEKIGTEVLNVGGNPSLDSSQSHLPMAPEGFPPNYQFEESPSTHILEDSMTTYPSEVTSPNPPQEPIHKDFITADATPNFATDVQPLPFVEMPKLLERTPEKIDSPAYSESAVSMFQEHRQPTYIKKSNSTSQLVRSSEADFPQRVSFLKNTVSSCDDLNLASRSSRIATEDQPDFDLASSSSSSSSSASTPSSSTSNLTTSESGAVSNVPFKKTASAGGIMKTLKNSVKTIYNYPTSMTGTKSKIRSLWQSSVDPPSANEPQNEQSFQSQHHRRYYSTLNREVHGATEKKDDSNSTSTTTSPSDRKSGTIFSERPLYLP